MKILVIGSGGREHAILWALQKSARTVKLFCAPVKATDVSSLARFAEEKGIELTIVGSEAPLAAGVVDEFVRRGLTIAGASRAAARLESSKAFAKDFMAHHSVPTAHYKVANSAAEAHSILNSGEFGSEDAPVVLKADGLAAGKGVIVAGSRSEASSAVNVLTEGRRAQGFPFRGVLFIGLMLTADGPRVLEYNARLGDPEAQAILVRLQSDLTDVFEAVARGGLGKLSVRWSSESSVCVVLASGGYPSRPVTGARIDGLSRAAEHEGVTVFHAGTSKSGSGDWLTSGGRVLGVTAAGPTLETALLRCYGAVDDIHWDGMQYRRDIGRFTEEGKRQKV
jgi:phosphoribosylamine-glycine ligase